MKIKDTTKIVPYKGPMYEPATLAWLNSASRNPDLDFTTYISRHTDCRISIDALRSTVIATLLWYS